MIRQALTSKGGLFKRYTLSNADQKIRAQLTEGVFTNEEYDQLSDEQRSFSFDFIEIMKYVKQNPNYCKYVGLFQEIKYCESYELGILRRYFSTYGSAIFECSKSVGVEFLPFSFLIIDIDAKALEILITCPEIISSLSRASIQGYSPLRILSMGGNNIIRHARACCAELLMVRVEDLSVYSYSEFYRMFCWFNDKEREGLALNISSVVNDLNITRVDLYKLSYASILIEKSDSLHQLLRYSSFNVDDLKRLTRFDFQTLMDAAGKLQGMFEEAPLSEGVAPSISLDDLLILLKEPGSGQAREILGYPPQEYSGCTIS